MFPVCLKLFSLGVGKVSHLYRHYCDLSDFFYIFRCLVYSFAISILQLLVVCLYISGKLYTFAVPLRHINNTTDTTDGKGFSNHRQRRHGQHHPPLRHVPTHRLGHIISLRQQSQRP